MREFDEKLGAKADKELRGVLSAGTLVGCYQIVSVLGRGSFGVTYRACDIAADRDVAIKEFFPASLALREQDKTVLPISTEAAEEFVWWRDRFVEEQRILAKLSGTPAVVRVSDLVEAHGTVYLVMALVEGETLDRKLKRDGRLPQTDVDRLLGPLLDGLGQVHAAGFLHRDIKPANIIIDATGQPTLIDFGAARAAMSGRTQTLTAVFTPGYAPIEQFTSGRQGPFTDIYALGATLYQCVTGVVPPSAIDRVVGVEMAQIAAAVRSEYTPNLLAGIDAALVPTAVDRPQSVAQWREVFASGIGPGSSATRILPQRAAERSRRRNLWISAAAATLLVIAGGSYLALRPAPPPVVNAAEVEARQRAEAEATARRADEEQSRAALELRVKEAEAARRSAEDDRSRLEQAEKARQDAQRQAEDEARQKAEQEARQKAAVEAQRAGEANDEKKAEATETALRLSIVDRQHLQVALTSLGFDTHGNDGAFGPRSRQMISSWQKAHNQSPTGFLNVAQQQALLKEAASALKKYDDDQRKIEEEKRKAEEDAKKKAEEEAKARATTPPATIPSAASAASSTVPALPGPTSNPSIVTAPAIGMYDGNYSGTLTLAKYQQNIYVPVT